MKQSNRFAPRPQVGDQSTHTRAMLDMFQETSLGPATTLQSHEYPKWLAVGRHQARDNIRRQATKPVTFACPFSVGSAKRLAITIHGSAESITRALSARRTKVRSEKEFYRFKHLQDAPLEPLGQNPSLLSSKANAVDDAYCGMASIYFPSLLPDRRVEHGLWCRGCDKP